jgi:hypothetical protein
MVLIGWAEFLELTKALLKNQLSPLNFFSPKCLVWNNLMV